MMEKDCDICKWFSPGNEALVVFAGQHFTLFFPKVPMVYREDGGHLILIPNQHRVDIRDFNVEETIEYMAFMRAASDVFYDLLPKMNIPVGRINYHDNGNFEADKACGAHQHMHIYGRAKNAQKQKWKAPLVFPEWNPENPYFKESTHFDASEKDTIRVFVEQSFPQHFKMLSSRL